MKRLMILFLALAAVCNLAEARVVSGSVTCGKKKLSDVIVTDGKNFTKTQKGKFKFEIEDNATYISFCGNVWMYGLLFQSGSIFFTVFCISKKKSYPKYKFPIFEK